MKNTSFFLKIILILTSLMNLYSCQNNDDNEVLEVSEPKYLVDKIYNYNNDLIAEYFYDEEDKLIRKYVTEHLGNDYEQEWASYSDDFEYDNGLVSKIIHKDITHNMFNYETIISYNANGKIVKAEIYKNGQQISSNSNFRYKNDDLTGTVKYNLETMIYKDSILYNNSKNVDKYLYERPEVDLIGNPIAGTKITTIQEFHYDNHSKPNFNIDYLFLYEPLPFLELADLQRQLSTSNMTEFKGQAKWVYTYNEKGLPSTIEIIRGDGETTLPMLLRLKYRETE